jgi:hypothetical protein
LFFLAIKIGEDARELRRQYDAALDRKHAEPGEAA